MKIFRGVVMPALVVCSLGSGACGLDSLLGKSPVSSSTGDSTSVRSYLGTWTGPTSTSYSTVQSCGNLQWKVTSQTGSQISGDFLATCSGEIALAGTLLATHGETTIPWAASGTATQGSTSCPFNMTGAGTFQGTSNILTTYAGTSCVGPFNGSETLKR